MIPIQAAIGGKIIAETIKGFKKDVLKKFMVVEGIREKLLEKQKKVKLEQNNLEKLKFLKKHL